MIPVRLHELHDNALLEPQDKFYMQKDDDYKQNILRGIKMDRFARPALTFLEKVSVRRMETGIPSL
jgi:hypothetical protein